ncbi:hypothetical protein L873DRAFT_1793205 [Choiromyces venosus 120613-1]|uniref:Uncharacterized protein n=1 Tax=Choiromyces venosus 120613-1 TaxID=1336337 RepID=A0A3N4J6Z4_9PEZI|nr:hypothetical protein L873DRAFT_1793205 [Choiromyces venosus 120613-1]
MPILQHSLVCWSYAADPSSYLRPIISAKAALHSEVGHAASARWVTENATTETSISSLTSNHPRQNPRSVNTRGGVSSVPKKGKSSQSTGRWTGNCRLENGQPCGCQIRKEHGSKFLREQQLYRLKWHQRLKLGETDSRADSQPPVCAVSSSAVTPILAQQVVTLAPPEADPVTWSGPRLPFECLASHCGIDVPQGTTVITTQK